MIIKCLIKLMYFLCGYVKTFGILGKGLAFSKDNHINPGSNAFACTKIICFRQHKRLHNLRLRILL